MFRDFLEAWRICRERRRKKHKSFDIDEFEQTLNGSSVPGVTMLVLVWAVCALLLTLSVNHQRETSWRIGEKSPVNFLARCSFDYEDIKATGEKRAEARKKAMLCFKVDQEKSRKLEHDLNEFFNALIDRSTGKEVDISSGAKRAARHASADLIQYIAPRSEDFKARTVRVINRGILSNALAAQYNTPERPVRIEDIHGNTNHYELTLADCRGQEAALKEIFFACEEKFELCREFLKLTTLFFGTGGNLVPDQEATAAAAEAAGNIAPVMRHAEEKDILISRGEIITDAVKAKLDAERRHLPRHFEHNLLIFNLIGSISLLAVVLIYLAVLRPQIFRQPREIAVASLVIATSLWLNYFVIANFDKLNLPSPQIMIYAVPVVLPMVLLSVTFGIRTALCCGFLTTAVTTLMLSVTLQFQFPLFVRWLFIGGISAFAVRRVLSYRSFFVRIFIASAVLSAFFNIDTLYQMRNLNMRIFGIVVLAIIIVSFVVAILALVMIFVLELVFNLDTAMTLTVLANLNHPLLERLKREAPGTMFHSITVATLAEDAATAIGANALRAKVGALFHDIGKLTMPLYFTENNRSGDEHVFLAPGISSNIIRNHVKAGLELARRYHLFRYIRDAIATHHGDDLVRFFYEKALKNQRNAGEPESNVLESEFRYDGPPPDLKELAIISLADACEAASRSLEHPSEPRIRTLVDKIISERLQGGQLRNAQLTLAELATIRDCFIRTLVNIKHGRIAYNFEEKNESARDGVATPATAETVKEETR